MLFFRGKCSVSLLNELEDIHTYLDKEDTFYYSMVYDPNQKTLLVDKGEIRTGPDYQAEIPPYIDPGKEGSSLGYGLACSVWRTYNYRCEYVCEKVYNCVSKCVSVCIPD